MTQQNSQGLLPETEPPCWELTSEYPALDAPMVQAELAQIEANTHTLRTLSAAYTPVLEKELPFVMGQPLIEKAWDILLLRNESELLLHNLITYAQLSWSTETVSKAAKDLLAQLKKIGSQLTQAVQPMDIFLLRISDELFDYFLTHPAAQEASFVLRHERVNKERLLSLEKENLITALTIDGHQAWGNLYSNLSSSLKAPVEDENGDIREIGFAEMLSLLGGSSNTMRQRAHKAIHSVFNTHAESCAAILNALAGWRLEVCEQRSHTVMTSFLDGPLHMNRMDATTLDTMMQAIRNRVDIGRQAGLHQAELMQKSKLDPWDIIASAPALGSQSKHMSFPDAITLITQAFSEVHPDMGQFVQMMQEKQWIEARVTPNKQPGAYCDVFPRSRHPRVFMAYLGSTVDVIVLAHELGHAFHSWVMRDLPLKQTNYPMILAETASTFAETVVRDYLVRHAETAHDKLDILWHEIGSAARFTLNIPVRYAFEKAFYEQRAKRQLAPEDFKALMHQTWMDWYGPCMSDSDNLFWASKLHFFIVEMSFYNFPYAFGYLFSQGVYAQRAKLGDSFYDFYVNLLRDTGNMTAEDLVRKHMQRELGQPDFWHECLDIVAGYVQQFEATLALYRAGQT